MPSPKFIGNELAEKIVKVAKEQMDECLSFRKGRIEEIRKNEDAYFNKVPRTLKRRLNIPLPVMSGFVVTLLPQIDDAPIININPTERADLSKARKSKAM